MALVWLWSIAVFSIVLVNGASIRDKSSHPCKRVERHGDELFLVDDESCLNHHHHHHGQQKRSTDGNHHGRHVIRVGDELIVLKDDDDNNDDNNVDDTTSDDHRGKGIHRRAAVKDESYRWTDKTVPYFFDDTFGAKDQAIVKSAMDEWSRHTCVRFRPARSSDVNKVKFVQGDGCFSFVGMVEKTQTISLDQDGCRFVSTALHEIGHALGMYHTQVRPDRDQYIKVDMSDVAKKLQDNFDKQTWQSAHHYGVDYDFSSIMHYDGTSFTSNGGISIKTLDPKWQKIIGNAKHLSFGDIEMMNKMYHCAPKTCSLKDADCPGTSFVDQTCKCACPGSSADNPVVSCSTTGSGSGSGSGTGGHKSSSSSSSSSGNTNNNSNNNGGDQSNTGSSDGQEWTPRYEDEDEVYYGFGNGDWLDGYY